MVETNQQIGWIISGVTLDEVVKPDDKVRPDQITSTWVEMTDQMGEGRGALSPENQTHR